MDIFTVKIYLHKLILKGCEWNILNEDFKYIDNFSQILLEFHLPLNGMQLLQMENYIDKVF